MALYGITGHTFAAPTGRGDLAAGRPERVRLTHNGDYARASWIDVGRWWAVAGFALGALGAMVIAKEMSMPGREGTRDYFILAIGLIGAVIGHIAGLVAVCALRTVGAERGVRVVGYTGLAEHCRSPRAVAVGVPLREAPLQYSDR